MPALSFLAGKHSKSQLINTKFLLDIIPIGIEAYAFIRFCGTAFFETAVYAKSLSRKTLPRSRLRSEEIFQISCPEMQVNEIHALYDKHHKVSSFVEVHQNTHNSDRYEEK